MSLDKINVPNSFRVSVHWMNPVHCKDALKIEAAHVQHMSLVNYLHCIYMPLNDGQNYMSSTWILQCMDKFNM